MISPQLFLPQGAPQLFPSTDVPQLFEDTPVDQETPQLFSHNSVPQLFENTSDIEITIDDDYNYDSITDAVRLMDQLIDVLDDEGEESLKTIIESVRSLYIY